MAARATYRIAEPDKVETTLTLTMGIGEWRKLKEQLPRGTYPSWMLAQRIVDMISRAETFYSEEANDPDD